MIGQAYDKPPFHYTTDFIVNVNFQTDPKVVAALLPAPLKSVEPQSASIMVAHHRHSPFGPYFGAYLLVVANHRGKPVTFLLSGVKDIFAGVVAGREIWGMPLQMGSVAAQWQGELFTIRIGRTPDVPFCEVLLQLESRDTFAMAPSTLVYAPVPHGYEDPMKRLLVGVEMETSLDKGEFWSAKAKAKMLGGTPLDDWSQLPMLDVIDCSYMSDATIVLPGGQVIDRWEV